jgi:uncharacterized protein YifN (PemK superfamily)
MLRGQLAQWNPSKLTITRRPRVGEAYWIGMAGDAEAPEFTGYHPGIIIRTCSDFDMKLSTIAFVPVTSSEPVTPKPYLYKLERNPNPVDQDRQVWAVCNHIYTVRLARLERYWDGDKLVAPRIGDEDLTGIFHAIRYGFTAFNSHIEREVERSRILLEAEMEAKVEAKVNEELDRLTSPV